MRTSGLLAGMGCISLQSVHRGNEVFSHGNRNCTGVSGEGSSHGGVTVCSDPGTLCGLTIGDGLRGLGGGSV
jgi:hypothetical protein